MHLFCKREFVLMPLLSTCSYVFVWIVNGSRMSTNETWRSEARLPQHLNREWSSEQQCCYAHAQYVHKDLSKAVAMHRLRTDILLGNGSFGIGRCRSGLANSINCIRTEALPSMYDDISI